MRLTVHLLYSKAVGDDSYLNSSAECRRAAEFRRTQPERESEGGGDSWPVGPVGRIPV